MESIALTLGFLTAIIGSVMLMLSMRAKSMRALASRLGFRYVDRSLPESFSIDCPPSGGNPHAFNVIEGRRNGVEIVVFDSTANKAYRTFIAVRSDENPFRKGEFASKNILRSKGWTALIGNTLLGLPVWWMSTRQIENYLKNVNI